MRYVSFLMALLLATPALAYAPMQRDQCRAGLAAGAAALGLDQADIYAADRARHAVTPDGWCRLFGDDPRLGAPPFATLDWRAEGVDRLIEEKRPPEALELRITDWRAEPGDAFMRGAARRALPVDVALALRHVSDTRQLIVERLRISSGAGDELFLTAVLERVDFSSRAMTQVSMGSVALGRLNTRARLNGWVENRVLPQFDITGDPREIRRMVREGLARLPGNLFDETARANLDAFVAALPAPRGTLELGLRSDNRVMFSGLAGLLLYGKAMSGDDPVAALFDGVRADVIWSPDPNQAE
ncbi:hypothetical protein [Salibaculum sp.]|uniref:hypothetical protein n=1 Tax=Salibaculum sp. TaxID=2855480 RepID=UPI002B46330B|nr:hypothetical protein [Salibaculum sp.]HKL69675.1 hypothetical protein [Salibaculum sp.]